MSVDDLAHLIRTREYGRCLHEAAALLEAHSQDPGELARVYSAICSSKLALGDSLGAVAAGEEAVAAAEEAESPDLVGWALVDLASALSAARRYPEALRAFERYLEGLPACTAARCREGSALREMASTQHRAGHSRKAVQTCLRARRWFSRYGDERGAAAANRTLVQIHLDLGEPEAARPFLAEGDRYAAAHREDPEFLTDHLLDRARYHSATGNHRRSAQEAFQALELAGDDLTRQCRAQLFLSRNAIATGRPHEGLSFALAARVSAIDGRVYDLEFEASELLFCLLREQGPALLREVEASFRRQGVDIYSYISERTVSRLLRANQ